MSAQLFEDARTGAYFSPCRTWRYRLWRVWDDSLPRAVFCMMNPSTADEVHNDPTVQRCQERVKRWAQSGFINVGGVEVVNAFAWRETDSKKLPGLIGAGKDIIGPVNNSSIITACLDAGIVVCGWGNPGHTLLDRGPRLLALMREFCIHPYALRVNASGAPQHPLYIGYDALPQAI